MPPFFLREVDILDVFILLDEIKVSLRLKDFGSHIGHDREEITLHQFVIAKCHFESEAKSQGIDARNNLRQMKNKGRMTWLKKYDSRRELELRKSARREAIARDELGPVQFVRTESTQEFRKLRDCFKSISTICF